MDLNSLNDSERLVLLQALYSVIGEHVSTKNPFSLRSEMDEKYRELYETTGSKSFDMKLGDTVVGTYSIRFSKEKDSETFLDFEVIDHVALAFWFNNAANREIINNFVAANLKQFAEYYFTETGEMPEGCEIVKHIKPAVDKAYIGGALKINNESVANIIGNALPGIAGLLEGGVQ